MNGYQGTDKFLIQCNMFLYFISDRNQVNYELPCAVLSSILLSDFHPFVTRIQQVIDFCWYKKNRRDFKKASTILIYSLILVSRFFEVIDIKKPIKMKLCTCGYIKHFHNK